MGTLHYGMHISLDGYVEDASGGFEWGVPSEEMHRASNQQVAHAAALLFGRRMYETMEEYWTDPERADGGDVEAEFARAYVATPRIVFSDSLRTVADGCRLVRSADAEAEVQRLKDETGGALLANGPGLIASLAHLVDVVDPTVGPVALGGGKSFVPHGVSWNLTLVEQRAFASGWVYLRYQVVR